jgi:glycerol-3-phosphate dehydrogenase
VQRNLDALQAEVFDLLIVGGGITGAGVALDAALNGWRVALIDKNDFASGTSSASSKLIHGGLRYLEHGDVRLVHEALHERRILLRNAPHLVQPLRFVIPFYAHSRIPPWKWRAGLTLYDLLAGTSNIRRSRPLTKRSLGRAFPGLQLAGLRGGAEYFDAQMDDARLCIEVIQTAAKEGACVANYVEAVAFERSGEQIAGVHALDRIGGSELSIRAQQVLNATGPGVDVLCRLAGDTSGPHLQPTKGVHIIAPCRGLTAAFLLLHPADGRVFFVIPWMGHTDCLGSVKPCSSTKTLIGTTDTNWDEANDTLAVQPSEVDYLLDGFNHYFEPPLACGDLLGSFAGLRPLLRAKAADPSARSREFQLILSPGGLISAAGGKYTTYRRMAEVIMETLALRLGRRHLKRTRELPLDGAPEIRWERFRIESADRLCKRYALAEEAARHLLQRYGRHADDVAAYLVKRPALAEPVVPGEPDLQIEFLYQRDHEMAYYPGDHLLRRTRLGLFRPDLLNRPLPGLQ